MASGGRGAGVPEQGLHVATRAIVVDALAKGIGGTLTKNTTFTDELGLGAGTIQRALDLLGENEVLRTVSRGHLGRQIVSLDIGLAWQAARLSPVRVVVSPAGAVEMDVLESAIGDGLTALGIPHTMRHMRGGTPRMLEVREGAHDLTVVSGGTFEGTSASTGPSWGSPVRHLEPGTYYAPDRLVVLERTGGAGRSGAEHRGHRVRVAVDRESFDHEALTRAEFPAEDGFDLVDVPFTDVPSYVAAGIVDRGVWHVTRSPIPVELAGLVATPVARPAARRLCADLSRATLVVWPGRPENVAVLEALPLADLLGMQERGFAEEGERSARLHRARDAARVTG